MMKYLILFGERHEMSQVEEWSLSFSLETISLRRNIPLINCIFALILIRIHVIRKKMHVT